MEKMLERIDRKETEILFDNRWSDRESVYYGDIPPVDINFIKENLNFKANVLDISSTGIGLCHPNFRQEHVNQEVSIKFNNNSKYSLQGIITNFSQGRFSGKKENRIGIKIINKPSPLINRGRRFTSHDNFKPIAHCTSPFKYNHFSQYSILDFAAQGLTLFSDNISDILLPGMKVDFVINIPGDTNYKVPCEITNLRPGKTESSFFIGVTFINPHNIFLSSISAYLLSKTDSDYDAQELRENGFFVSQMEKYIQFSYVTNSQDWMSLLTLRLEAAHGEGRWLNTNDPRKMIDPYDKNSRHLIAKIGNKVVASARVTFNDGDLNQSEHNEHIDIPDFIQKKGFIEFSRVCTKPGFRGANLFVKIIQQCCKVSFQMGFTYGVLNCEDSLVKIYKKIGAKSLNCSFTNQFMNGKVLNVLYFDIRNCIIGKNINPAVWSLVLQEVFEYFLKNNALNLSLKEKVLTYFRKIVGKKILSIQSEKKLKHFKNKRDLTLEKIRGNKSNI